MKKLYILAALLMATSSAHAGGITFQINGERIRVEAPRNCNAISCVKVISPGYTGTLGNVDLKGMGSKSKSDDDVVAAPAAPAAPAPAQATAPQPAPFNVSGTASPSNIACATPLAAPTNLTATLVGEQTWDLAWTDNSAEEDGYEVWGYAAYIQCVAEGEGYPSGYSEGEYLIARLPANSTVYRTTDDPGVGPCGIHTLGVRATKGAGFSSFAGIQVIP